jgi:nucleoside-diphosphate-sugar epimerase
MLASRGERPLPDELRDSAEHVVIDRADTVALEAAVGSGVDVLVDCVAFESEHAHQLLSLAPKVGSLIVVSTGSVYVDAEGRTLDEARDEAELPVYPVPIGERQPTVQPGDETYSTKKAAIERILLEQDRVRATVVRPFAIHGPYGTSSREWHFVKRALDGRRVVLLAGRGAGRFQTTSVDNLAELIRRVAERPRTAAFNCGDPDSPTVLEISRAIAAALEHEWAELLFDRPEPWRRGVASVGDTPWSADHPIVADMTAAEIDLGYRPVTSYRKAVRTTCEWLVAASRDEDWRAGITGSAIRLGDSFDYAAEDAFVRSLTDG